MMATHLALPYWLEDAATPEAIAVLQDPAGPLFSLLMVIIISTTIHSFRERLDLPVAPQRKVRMTKQKVRNSRQLSFFRRAKANSIRGQGRKQREGLVEANIDRGDQLRSNQSREKVERDLDRPRRPVRVPHQSELPEWEPPQDDSGLIMLEID